jgi:hypothetical protein
VKVRVGGKTRKSARDCRDWDKDDGGHTPAMRLSTQFACSTLIHRNFFLKKMVRTCWFWQGLCTARRQA